MYKGYKHKSQKKNKQPINRKNKKPIKIIISFSFFQVSKMSSFIKSVSKAERFKHTSVCRI